MDIVHFTEIFKELVREVAEIAVNFLELLSIGIIVFTTFMAFYKLVKHDKGARIYLLHGQSIGLTFKLGSEILRTITVRNLDEIWQIALLIAIKAAMTWLIHWEVSDEQAEEQIKHGQTPPESHSILPHLHHPHTTVIVNAADGTTKTIDDTTDGK